MLTIVHVNINSITRKVAELKDYLATHQVDILCVVESKHRSIPEMPGYTSTEIAPQGSNRLSRGTIVYVKRHLHATKLNIQHIPNTETTMLSIKIHATNTNFNLHAVYCPPKTPLSLALLEAGVNHDNDPNLIVGDFNANHPKINLKNRNMTDRSGTQIVKFLRNTGMIILNPPIPTFLRNRTRPDLVIGDGEILDVTEMCTVNDDLTTDHRAINLVLSITNEKPERKGFYQWKQANHEKIEQKYQSKSEDESIILDSKTKIDLATEKWTQDLIEAISHGVPIQKNFIRNFSLPRTIKKKIITQRSQLRKQKPINKPEVNKLSRKIKQEITKWREKQQVNKDNKIRALNNCKSFWQEIKKVTGTETKEKEIALKINDTITTKPDLIGEEMVDHFLRMSTKPADNVLDLSDEEVKQHQLNHPDYYSEYWQGPEDLRDVQDKFLMQEITEEELKLALKETKNRAAGPDKINKQMLDLMPNNAFKDLLLIMNSSLTLGYFPAYWKLATIQPVKKPFKDPTETTSYRPISLLSIPGKIYERIINNRLQHYLEHFKVFPENQMGFRKNRGSQDQCLLLSHEITTALHKKEHLVAIMYDLEKAFDRCWLEGLVYKISTKKILPCRMTKLVHSFLQDRKIQVRANGHTSSVRVTTAGTPQGSVLSPTLFILYLADLPEIVAGIDGVKILQYADDICMYTKSGYTRTEKNITKKKLQTSIGKLEQYAHKWRIKLNSLKTQHITFHGRKRKRNLPKYTLTLNNTKINSTNSLKYLGITYDSNGKYNTHAEDVFSQAKQKLKHIYGLRMRNAITEKQTTLLFNTMVRSKIEYAIAAWWPTINKEGRKKILNLEKRSFKIAKKLPEWTPTSYVESLGFDLGSSQQRIKSIGQKQIQKSPFFIQMNESEMVENSPIHYFNQS